MKSITTKIDSMAINSWSNFKYAHIVATAGYIKNLINHVLESIKFNKKDIKLNICSMWD